MSQEKLDSGHAHLACQMNATPQIFPLFRDMHIELMVPKPSDKQESKKSKRNLQLHNLRLRLVPKKSAENYEPDTKKSTTAYTFLPITPC